MKRFQVSDREMENLVGGRRAIRYGCKCLDMYCNELCCPNNTNYFPDNSNTGLTGAAPHSEALREESEVEFNNWLRDLFENPDYYTANTEVQTEVGTTTTEAPWWYQGGTECLPGFKRYW